MAEHMQYTGESFTRPLQVLTILTTTLTHHIQIREFGTCLKINETQKAVNQPFLRMLPACRLGRMVTWNIPLVSPFAQTKHYYEIIVVSIKCPALRLYQII